MTDRRLCALAIVGLELGGGGGGGLVALVGQFMLILTTLGDFGGGDGLFDGAADPPRPAGGTGLVGFDSSGGGFGARLGLPKFKVGGFVGILGGFRLMAALSVESFCVEEIKESKWVESWKKKRNLLMSHVIGTLLL